MHRNQVGGWTVLLACAVLLPMSSLWLLRLALWSSWLLALVHGLGPWPWSWLWLCRCLIGSRPGVPATA